MRVVVAGDYPDSPPDFQGGIQAVVYNTLQSLVCYQDLDLQVITCEKWHRRPPALGPAVAVAAGRLTIHHLPSSPRVPHTLSMLSVDRWAISRLMADLAPDVIHAHGQAAAYPFAAFDTGRPTVVTVHGINSLEAAVDRRGGSLKSWLRLALWRATEHRCLRHARDVITISPFVRQTISPYTSARLHDVENPVHPAFLALEPAPLPGRVLLTCTVQKAKGVMDAVRAMELVRRQVPNAELVVAGRVLPPYREYSEQVRRYLTDSGASSYVHLVGHLDHRALLDAYRTSQVFVFPSWLESSPVAVAEAMAAGLPSVVSDIGGTAHLVAEGVTGYRVPPRDVQGLAERLIQLLRDGDARHRFGKAAREIARARFSPALAARKHIEIYRDLGTLQPASPAKRCLTKR